MKNNKHIIDWTKDDLELLKEDPFNFENKEIEYKLKYDDDPNELRKDIVSFANTKDGGYILYGIKEKPFELVGIKRNDIDNLKNTIDQTINRQIDPKLDPFPVYQPIHLSDDLYIFGIQIFPKTKGIYAIRKSENPNNKEFQLYSFWIRSDGRKRQISMEEVNNYIIDNDPYKRYIEVFLDIELCPVSSSNKIYDHLTDKELKELIYFTKKEQKAPKYLVIQGINRSTRPIYVEGFRLLFWDEHKKDWFMIKPPSDLDWGASHNTHLAENYKLKDGEICAMHYPLPYLNEVFEKYKITLPIKFKGIILTREEEFSSEEIVITSDEFNNVWLI